MKQLSSILRHLRANIIPLVVLTAIACGLWVWLVLIPILHNSIGIMYGRDGAVILYSEILDAIEKTEEDSDRQILALNVDAPIRFDNSTDYFRYAFEFVDKPADYTMFSIPAPDLSYLRSTNGLEFLELHNGWNVVEGVFDDPAAQNLPFLISRNLELKRLDEDLSQKHLAFWDGVIVVNGNGAGYVIKEKGLRKMKQGFGAPNRVLAP